MDQKIEKIITGYQDPTIQGLLKEYFESNEAARIFVDQAGKKGWPVIVDHITFRCMDVEERAKEFLQKGFEYRNELIEYPDQGWWAKVYRKEGYPSIFIDQAYTDEKGKKSLLPHWVSLFGENILHHIAVIVEDIEEAIAVMKEGGVEFSGNIVGPKGTRLRQIFSASEVRKGEAYSVLELTERNQYDGFVPEQADGLMQSSVKTKSSPGKGS